LGLVFGVLSETPAAFCHDTHHDTHRTQPAPQNANDLIGSLLQRDPTVRLCDPARLKAHPFFASLDWAKLADLAVTPPYIPPVVRSPPHLFIYVHLYLLYYHTNMFPILLCPNGEQKDETSVEMIDPLFTTEAAAANTPTGLNKSLHTQAHIQDFTYISTPAIISQSTTDQ